MRAAILTLALALLAILAWWPETQALLGGQRVYRLFLVFGLPVAVGLLSAAIAPRSTVAPAPGGSPDAARRLAPWCVAAFVADYAFLGIGHRTGWLTFTFGDMPLYGHPVLIALWALPACLAAGVWGWEVSLRGRLLPAWRAHVAAPAAAALSGLAGLLLAAPSILEGAAVRDAHFTAAAIVSAACREAAFCLIVLCGGGVALAGLYRGLLLYVDALLVNDWYSLYFPAANFTSSDPVLYLARGGCAVLALALVALGARRAWRGVRAAGAAEARPEPRAAPEPAP